MYRISLSITPNDRGSCIHLAYVSLYLYKLENGSHYMASEPTPCIFVFTLGGWRFQKIIET